MDDKTIRLDKWLWFARVVKTRTNAQKLVQGSNIRLNKTKVSKPAVTVSIGDILTISIHDQIRIYKVLSCGVRRSSYSLARLLYEDLTPAPARTIAQNTGYTNEKEARPDKYHRRKLMALKRSKNYY